MSYTPMRRDTVDKCCGGNTHPQSEAAPQTYSPEHEHEHATAFPPPHCVPAAAHSVHGSNYAPPWNARFGGMGLPVPYVNDMARGHSILTEAQQSAPFAPVNAMNALIPYKNQNQNQDTGSAANGPMAYLQDNRIPGRDLHGWGTTGIQPGGVGVINYGPTLGLGGTSAQSAAEHNVQFAPGDEAPAPSESLRTLTRRYVLDPGTRIETVNIGPNGYGRLIVTITLEAADGA